MLGVRSLSIIIFGILMFLVLAKRPKFLTTPNGEWKSFGFGADQTCCNITVITVIIALLSYLLSAVLTTVISDKFKQRGGDGTNGGSNVEKPIKQLAFDAQFFA